MTESYHNSSAPPFLKPEAVAKELAISTRAVYRLIGRGELWAVNIAPDPASAKHPFYRVHREWLHDFLERRANGGPATPPAPPRRRGARQKLRPRRDHFAD